MVICLERDADLHMAQLMRMPLTVYCFSKIQIGFTFLVLAHPGSPGQRAVKRVCVCVRARARVCVRVCARVCCGLVNCGSSKPATEISTSHQLCLDGPLVFCIFLLQCCVKVPCSHVITVIVCNSSFRSQRDEIFCLLMSGGTSEWHDLLLLINSFK